MLQVLWILLISTIHFFKYKRGFANFFCKCKWTLVKVPTANSGAGTAYPFKNMSSPPVFIGVYVNRSLVLCLWFVDLCPFFLSIVLSILLRYTDSDYPLVSSNPSYNFFCDINMTIFIIKVTFVWCLFKKYHICIYK
jgi:hypothetical protein